MPITEQLTIEYKMPVEIRNKFSKEAMIDFREKVIETFKQNDRNQGREPSSYEKETYSSWWIYMEGTGGFYESFKFVCEQHNLLDVLNYYHHLPWYDSDLFDSELGDLLISYELVELGVPDLEADAE